MIEHINYSDLGDREVFLYWKDKWYRLPFFLLEDVADGWLYEGRKVEANELKVWIERFRFTHSNEVAIPQIKKILESEMPLMIAFQYDTDQPLTDKAGQFETQPIEHDVISDQWLRNLYPDAPEFKNKKR